MSLEKSLRSCNTKKVENDYTDMKEKPLLSVIIPCFNDANCLIACLDALSRQSLVAHKRFFEVIIVLNGCTDHSAQVARDFQEIEPKKNGTRIRIEELARPSKSAALNAGDALAAADIRVYLDADVICAPDLLESLLAVLNRNEPLYATGTITIVPPRSWISRAYGEFWLCLVMHDVNGIGLYAVNGEGRKRWETFPSLHSDDKFVRLNFSPDERVRVSSRYHWPLPEGWTRLLMVRLRWTEGNIELKRLFPEMVSRHTRAKRPFMYIPLILGRPLSFLVFFSIYIVCRLLVHPNIETVGVQWRRAR